MYGFSLQLSPYHANPSFWLISIQTMEHKNKRINQLTEWKYYRSVLQLQLPIIILLRLSSWECEMSSAIIAIAQKIERVVWLCIGERRLWNCNELSSVSCRVSGSFNETYFFTWIKHITWIWMCRTITNSSNHFDQWNFQFKPDYWRFHELFQ